MSSRFELPPLSAETNPNFDGLVAAPDSHFLIDENDKFRDLAIVLRPGAREPFHHHQWQSVMRVMRSTPLRYYLANGSSIDMPERAVSLTEPFIEELGPEPLHSVENLSDTYAYLAIRRELKPH